MSKETAMLQFKYEEIFQENPDNPEELIMTIPEEILKEKNWVEGTPLKIFIGDQGTLVIQELKDKEDE